MNGMLLGNGHRNLFPLHTYLLMCKCLYLLHYIQCVIFCDARFDECIPTDAYQCNEWPEVDWFEIWQKKFATIDIIMMLEIKLLTDYNF